ncbi:MAG: thioesterase [Ilumatobacteraceae bacterium]|nr:thioesterase [Ilumatobacteraceae bacterium]
MSRAEQFAALDPDVERRWRKFGAWDRVYYPTLLGMVVDEVRVDYCRMTLPYRPELEQPAGLVHGGAIASLLDAVVVPAVGSAYGREARYSTVDMHVQFLSAVRQADITAEGWIVRRGRSVVFCESEAVDASSGRIVAKSVLTYSVSGS